MFSDNRRLPLLALLVFVVTILVYIPALQNGFVNWDDNEYVYENLHIRSIDLSFVKWAFTSFDSANWHPLTWISHAADHAVWGLAPTGHHLTSIIFHGLNTFLVVLLVMRLVYAVRGREKGLDLPLAAGAVTGLLFGLHPIHVESVAWVSERKDLLCAFFFLLSILSYLRYTAPPFNSPLAKGGHRGVNYILSLLFFVLALMSKPMAVTLPVVLIIFDIYPLGRLEIKNMFSSQRKVLAEKIPFLCLSLTSSIITVTAQQSGGAIMSSESVALTSRVLAAFKALIFYLYKMVWPTELAPLYPYPAEISFFSPEYSGALILTACITAGCVLTRKKQKVFSAAWAYYVVTLLPVLGIIQVGPQAAADRYTYLPSLGLFILIGLGAGLIYEKRTRKKYLVVAVLIALSILSFLTIKQTGIWKDSLTLWNRELGLYSSRIAYNNRGVEYFEQEQYQKALSDIEMAVELFPSYTEAYYNRGRVYLKLSDYAHAISDLNRAIVLDPLLTEAYYNRGTAYLKLGNYRAAVDDLSSVIELDVGYAPAYNNRGDAFFRSGRYDEAIRDISKAIGISPSARAYYNLGTVYMKLGNYKEAAANYASAIELDDKYSAAYNNRGTIYFRLKMYSKAIADFSNAIDLDPENVSAYKYRGICYKDTGEAEKSNMDFRAAARLGDKGARAYLGSIGIDY